MASYGRKVCEANPAIATRLIRERITQAELAKKVGVSPGTVWRWLNNQELDRVRVEMLQAAITDIAEKRA